MSFLTSAFTSHPNHHVFIVGGSYAGLVAALTLLRLLDGLNESLPFPGTSNASKARPTVKGSVKITLLDERDGFFHTIGTPLAHASLKHTPTAWKLYDEIPWLQNSRTTIKQGSIQSIDCSTNTAIYRDTKTGKNTSISYDFLVTATGLKRAFPIIPTALSKEQYLLEATEYVKPLTDSKLPIAVVGGGAVGIEFAAELKDTYPDLDVKLIHSRAQLLSAETLPDEFKSKVLDSLHSTCVDTILSKRVLSIEKPFNSSDSDPARTLILDDGTRVRVGKVINCAIKFHPNTTYLPSDVLNSEGYVNITSHLNFTSHPTHFAIGDIAHWSGIKRCGMAMHMGMMAGANIHALILSKEDANFEAEKEMDEYPHVPPMIGLAIGKIGAGYSPEGGMMIGEEYMQMMFGNDLGFTICANIMQLDEELNPAGTTTTTITTTITTAPEQPTGPQVDESQAIPAASDQFAAIDLRAQLSETPSIDVPINVNPVAEAIKA